MKDAKREIIEKGVQALLDSHKVPYRVHAAVIQRLGEVIKEYKGDVIAARAERALHLESLAARDQIMNEHERQLNEWDAFVKHVLSLKPKKGEPGDRGKNGRDGKNAEPVDVNAIARLVLSLLPSMPEMPDLEVPILDEEALFAKFVKWLKRDKSMTISDLRDGQSFIFNKKKYKVEELMHGGGGSSSGASANVITEYSLVGIQSGNDVTVDLSQLTHFATFSNVIAAMRNQIPQTNGVTCTITATTVTFLNADAAEVFSITYAYT